MPFVAECVPLARRDSREFYDVRCSKYGVDILYTLISSITASFHGEQQTNETNSNSVDSRETRNSTEVCDAIIFASARRVEFIDSWRN